MYPKINSSEKEEYVVFAATHAFKEVTSPSLPKPKFTIAIKAMNTKSMAPTLAANLIPSVVPFAMASKRFDPIFSLDTTISLFTSCS